MDAHGIPAGDIMVLGVQTTAHGSQTGGGLTSGPAPGCVSYPSRPPPAAPATRRRAELGGDPRGSRAYDHPMPGQRSLVGRGDDLGFILAAFAPDKGESVNWVSGQTRAPPAA